jgi:glycosyltransferase involved in cell wall biosynthesis
VLQPACRPRVLFITAAFPPQHVPEADHALHECLHLAQAGYEVHVLTTRREVEAPEGITVHAIMDSWSWREAPKVWRLARELRAGLHMLFFAGWLYDYRTMMLAIPLLLKAASRRAPLITKFTTVGTGEGGKSGGGFKRAFRRLAFRLAGRWRYGALLSVSSRIVVQSTLHQSQLQQLWPGVASKVAVVPPSPILPIAPGDGAAAGRRGRERLGVQPDEFLVTFFGRLYPGKGIENLLDAVAELAKSRPKLRLAIVGGYFDANAWFTRRSYPQELAEKTAALGLDQRVVWSGEYAWDSQEPSEYLYGSDVIALPFDLGVHFYNSSFAGALTHGRPIIVTRGSSVEAPIVHGENVFMIPPADVDALASSIATLMDDEGLREKLAEGAHRLAAEWFGWDRAIEQILGPFRAAPAVPAIPAEAPLT